MLWRRQKRNSPGCCPMCATASLRSPQAVPPDAPLAATGTGLSADQMAQLFQPFNRLGQQDGAEEGTGIGLVVTKQLVELMGGAIGVESAVGVGTVLWVEFESSQAPALENIEKAALDRRLLAAPEASEQLPCYTLKTIPPTLPWSSN